MGQDEGVSAQELIEQLKRMDFFLHRKIWRDLEIKERPPNLMILTRLRKAAKLGGEGLRVSELATCFGITASGVTQMVTGLEERGLVLRKMDPADRRAVLVSLTEEGERAAESIIKAIDQVFTGLVNYLGEEKSRQFLDLMNDITLYFDNRGAQETEAPRERTKKS